MAHANPYTPGQVETLEQAQNELVKLADVVNQIIANQKLLQRDDGCLADCAVVPHTLSDEVVRMIGHFELLGAYADRPYQKGQVVTYRDRMYVCVIPHQGGTVMDTAAWRLIGKAGCCCEGDAAGGSGSGSGGGGSGGDEPKYIYKQEAYGSVNYGSTPEAACSGTTKYYGLELRYENGTCNGYNSEGKLAKNFGGAEKILLQD